MRELTLADAEHDLRQAVALGDVGVALVMTEYDRRGAELERRAQMVEAFSAHIVGVHDALDLSHEAEPGVPVVTIERLRARLAALEAIERRADEASTWCGDSFMHRAVRYIRTGLTGDPWEVSS